MSRLGIIDTHAHLDDNRFDSDRAAVMERLARDMEAVITHGTTYESSVASVEMAEQYDFVYAAVGWHRRIWLALKTKVISPNWKSWSGSTKK